MFLKTHFRLLFIMFCLFFSHTSFSSESAYSMIKVPNTKNEFISIDKSENDGLKEIIVSLITPIDNSIKKARSITYFSKNRKIVDVFFSSDKEDTSLFVVTKDSVDKDSSLEGVIYNTFIYDIYMEDISLNRIPVNVFTNCIDGKDLEKNIALKCDYKNKKEILNYFNK